MLLGKRELDPPRLRNTRRPERRSGSAVSFDSSEGVKLRRGGECNVPLVGAATVSTSAVMGASGVYRVTHLLPQEGAAFQYRIKNVKEPPLSCGPMGGQFQDREPRPTKALAPKPPMNSARDCIRSGVEPALHILGQVGRS